MNGVINLLKPPGMTSSDAVVWLKRIMAQKKVGHGGTLDPQAAGVLPILAGKATKLFDYLLKNDKTYIAQAVFGYSTDTQDVYGKLSGGKGEQPELGALETSLKDFTGVISQVPPAYSAIKHDGKRAYDLAREGAPPKLEARMVRINTLELLSYDGSIAKLRINCSSGTYIRALINDIGDALGTKAHMGLLVRTAVGSMNIADSVTVERILSEGVEPLISPPDAALGHLGRVDIDEKMMCKLSNGVAQRVSYEPQETVRVYCGGEFVALASIADEIMKFKVILC